MKDCWTFTEAIGLLQMMKEVVDEKHFLSLMLLLISTRLYAGSPGGIVLFVQPLPAGENIKYMIDGFFVNYYGMDNDKTPSCNPGNYAPNVDQTYLDSLLPEGLSKAQLVDAVNSRNIRKKISEVLSKIEYEGVVGFDGVMLYEIKDNFLNIYTFALYESDKIYTTTMEAKLLSSDKDLGHAICSSLNRKIVVSFEL